MWRAIRFLVLSVAAIAVCLYLFYVAYFFTQQNEMVFRASPLPKDYTFEYGKNTSEVTIPASDGVTLNGLLFRTANAKGLIFYLHGNAGNLSQWGDIASFYNEIGYDIFILDYRGFGKSTGSIKDEAQVLDDVQTAYNQLKKSYVENKIVIFGYSIGTGPATYLASKNPARALVLQAPYYNFSELEDTRAPYFPEFLKHFTFKTNEWLPEVKEPVLIFHGDADQLIPYSDSEKLAKLLKPSGRLITLPGQGHLGINENERYRAEVTDFLR